MTINLRDWKILLIAMHYTTMSNTQRSLQIAFDKLCLILTCH